MKRWAAVLAFAFAGAAWTAGCGGDSDDGASGSGGSSGGSGGSGGSVTGGGSGGLSGGGSGGSGGSTSGGGSGGGDAGSCAPVAPASGWQPSAYKPAKVQLGSCTTAMIAEYIQKCEASNEPPCAAFGASSDAAKATCEACLWSKLSDTSWSALLTFSKDYSLLNQPGCFELLGGEGAAECASAISDAVQCTVEACKGCITDNKMDASCREQAPKGVCKTSADAVGKVCMPFASSQCFKTDMTSIEAVVAGFCGPAGSDGGTDGGGDAASDASQD